jgi:hypothetical protein
MSVNMETPSSTSCKIVKTKDVINSSFVCFLTHNALKLGSIWGVTMEVEIITTLIF